MEAADERDYLLKVQNDRGADQYGVSLRVKGEATHCGAFSLVIHCHHFVSSAPCFVWMGLSYHFFLAFLYTKYR